MDTDTTPSYEEQINRLIPLAETKAGEAAPESRYPDKQVRDKHWTQAFHAEMDRLAEERGLRRSVPGAGI